MKATIIIALFAGAAAGAGTAAISSVFMSDDSAGDTLAAVDPLDDTEALFGLVAHLRDENQALTDRMQILESRVAMAAAPRTPAEVVPLEDASNLADLTAKWNEQPTTREISRMKFVLEEIEAEKQSKRAEERRVREDQRLDEQIAKLTEKLGLDAGQAKSMRDILANQNIRRTELFAGMRDGAGGMDRTNIRDTMREFTETTNAQFQSVLSPTQYETYIDDNGNRGFGRGLGYAGDRGDRGDRNNRGNRGDR